MKVWVKAPRNAPVMIDVPNELHALQEWVGGFIEVLENNAYDPAWAILCNEEGRIKGLPANCRIGDSPVLVGTILFIGTKGEYFCDCPLSLEDVEEMCK